MSESKIIFDKSTPKKAVLNVKVAAILHKMPGSFPNSAKQAQYLLHWLDASYTQEWTIGSRLALSKLGHNGQRYEQLRCTIKMTGRKNWLGGRKLFVANCVKYLSQFFARKRSFNSLLKAVVWEWRWLKLQFK